MSGSLVLQNDPSPPIVQFMALTAVSSRVLSVILLTPEPSPSAGPLPIVRPMKTWMRRRGDRVTITTGKYAGHTDTVESNVYQGTAYYPDERATGHQVM